METAKNFITDDNRWQGLRHDWYWSLPDTHLFTLYSIFSQRYWNVLPATIFCL